MTVTNAVKAVATHADEAVGATLFRLDVPTRPAYMPDSTQVRREIELLAHQYPDYVRLVDAGITGRQLADPNAGHSIPALIIGRHVDDASIPRTHLTAGVHARETANTPLTLAWNRRVVERAAAGDPAFEALLRERTVISQPLVNWDGHDIVVRGLDTGNADEYWRRTNDGLWGPTDLNRNQPNRWGEGSLKIGHQNYRGRFAGSEPEGLGFRRLAEEWMPRAHYDIHSPGGVILAPTGIPDAQAAAELASRASGYAISSSDAHWVNPVGGGTFKDWAHDQLHAVSLTIETGAVHHQTDAQYAETLRRMLPTLDALVATVDGTHDAPRAARMLANPREATPFVLAEHLQGVSVRMPDGTVLTG